MSGMTDLDRKSKHLSGLDVFERAELPHGLQLEMNRDMTFQAPTPFSSRAPVNTRKEAPKNDNGVQVDCCCVGCGCVNCRPSCYVCLPCFPKLKCGG